MRHEINLNQMKPTLAHCLMLLLNRIPEVCWFVTDGDTEVATFARTGAQARWHFVASAREAGYYLNRWPSHLRSDRYPTGDDRHLRHHRTSKHHCWNLHDFLTA